MYLHLDAIGSELFDLPRDDDDPFGPGNDQNLPGAPLPHHLIFLLGYFDLAEMRWIRVSSGLD